jgi:type I restriction enzyme S subunit
MNLAGAVRANGNQLDWPETQMRAFLTQSKETASAALPLLGVSVATGVRQRWDGDGRPAASADLSAYKLVRPGDIVMNALGKPHGSIGASPTEGITSPAYWVMRVDRKAHSRFVHYLLRSSHLVAEYQRLGKNQPPNQFDISWTEFRRITVPLPDVSTQRAIADYLERETARIDTLIKEQELLIEMLRERRWAVVERSVALLGWNTPFKAVAVLIQTGPFGSQLKSDEYEEGGTPIINPSHIVAGEVRHDQRIAVGADKARELARHALEEGDLVASRRGELGRCAVVGTSAAGFLCGTGSALIRLDRTVIEPSFAALVFGSRRNRDALALASVGSTMDNLNSDIIGSLRIPVPTLEEQRQLVVEVKQATAKIDKLIAETERFIEIARERRAALITAAVTGQIDVREVA